MPHYPYRYLQDLLRSPFPELTRPDLKPDNILLEIEDNQIIWDLIQDEKDFPSPTKVLSDRCIYPHRNFGDFKGTPGRPKIGDFGLAVQAVRDLYYHPIQPDCLQAPEVILGAGWSYSADIWNLGAMVSASCLPNLLNY